MVSSHQVKRFFNAFSWVRVFLFRQVLQRLFIWRLKILQPDVVILGLDTMVMNNNYAKCRHGVEPTYKNVNGFQPLQMNWERLIIDAVFRGGSKHSNHGDTVVNMVKHIVSIIRKNYRKDVPIIIRMDSGFFDQKIFKEFEKLKIGYICGGRMYADIKKMAAAIEDELWQQYCLGGKDFWEFIEFATKCDSWDIFRRAIYCRLTNNGDQLYLPKFRPDTIIVTNIGQGQKIDELLIKAGVEYYLDADSIVSCYHERGSDELVNRALKNFGNEQLPFKKFNPNAAWYYTMLIGHFLMVTFQEDVSFDIVPIGAYANTIRRRLLDVAGKIVSHSGKIILKVTRSSIENSGFIDLFERCKIAPAIQ